MSMDKAIEQYLASSVTQAFFLVVGDARINEARAKLSEMGFEPVGLSECCSEEDKRPDLDVFPELLRQRGDKTMGLGLGEFLALLGKREARQYLSGLKDLELGNKKCVLLLRGVAPMVAELKADPRFDNRRVFMADDLNFDLSVQLTNLDIELSTRTVSLKAFLAQMENGKRGGFLLKTILRFPESMISIKEIESAYAGIRAFVPNFRLPETSGTQEQWRELLVQINAVNGSFEKVLEKEGFGDSLVWGFYKKISTAGFRGWLYFLALKKQEAHLENAYLKYVLETTERHEDLEQNVLHVLRRIDPIKDPRFTRFKEDRGKLIQDFPEGHIADFVRKNSEDKEKGLLRLSDRTKVEREAILEHVAELGNIPDSLAAIYPDLAAYLSQYNFQCDALSEKLTDYFEHYKRQKVLNSLDDDFLVKVNSYAQERPYNRLPTRNELVGRLSRENSSLFWIDSLGVEYLAFIQDYSTKNKLSMVTHIGRAELPTITRINKGFYDEWSGEKEPKIDQLDKVKHETESDSGGKINIAAGYLAKELEIIREVLEEISLALNQEKYTRCYIVSDHGASRLAVLKKQIEKYETRTKGEHSGRCCQLGDFQEEGYNLPFATEENGYCVLADYGRFKGSRAAVVEVHGGASLEEVVVPVIELSLGDQALTVNLEKEVLTVGYQEKLELIIRSSKGMKAPYLKVMAKTYPLKIEDTNRYSALLSDVHKVGRYEAEVYDGDTLVARLGFTIESKIAKIDEDFDSLF